METLEKRQLKDFVKLKEFRTADFSVNFKYPLLFIALITGLLVFNSNEAKQEPKQEQVDTLETFNEFVERVLKDEPKKREIYHLANVSNTMQRKLKDSVKLDMNGFEWIIGSSDILHIRNRHGNFKKESSRGQINVTAKDYQKIYSIINAPDNISLLVNIKSGEKILKLSKYFNKQKYTYIVSISKKKYRLTGKTMYIKKAPTIKSVPF